MHESVTGRIESEMQGQNATGKCVSQKRNPGTPQDTPGLGADRPHVCLRVINVADLEGPVSMARRAFFQLPVERLLLVSSTAASPL